MREMGGKKKMNLTMKILVSVIIVLVLFIAYFFVVNPGINRFAQNNYYQGANDAYASLVSQIQEQGYFALPLGQDEAGEDQTLVLVPYVQPEQGAQTQ